MTKAASDAADESIRQSVFSGLYSSVKGIAGATMPLALHETGLIPTPSAMFPTSAPWILFNIWAGYETSNNTVANRLEV